MTTAETETLFRQYILIRITCILNLLFNVWCGFPGGSVNRVCLQCGSPGFNPWIGKTPQKRKWQSTPVFLSGRFRGQRSPVGYSPWGRKKWDTTEWLTLSLSLWCGGFSRWLSGKESTCQCRSCRFNPWVRKIPWRRKWQPTPVFLPGEFLGQRSLVGVHGIAKSQTELRDWAHSPHVIC